MSEPLRRFKADIPLCSVCGGRDAPYCLWYENAPSRPICEVCLEVRTARRVDLPIADETRTRSHTLWPVVPDMHEVELIEMFERHGDWWDHFWFVEGLFDHRWGDKFPMVRP